MDYVTVDDVYKSVKTLTKTDDQTATITSFIQEEEAILNGILSYKYVLPIAGGDETKEARTILRGIVIYKVLARLEIFLNLRGDQDGQAIVDKITYWSMYKNTTAKLEKNKIKLKNVPVIDNFVASNFPKSRFDRNVDQW